MKNEEKAEKLGYEKYPKNISYSTITETMQDYNYQYRKHFIDGALAMAKWKDEQAAQEKKQLIEKLDEIEAVIVFDLKRDFSKYEKIEGYLQEMREKYDVSNEYKYAHDCGVLKAIVQRFYSTIKDIDNIIKTK